MAETLILLFKTTFKLGLIGALLIALVSITPTSSRFEREKDTKPKVNQEIKIVSKPLDNRAQILRDYLAQYNSPLQYHSQDFIDAADAYDMDWKLVPAISGVESTFGKHIPYGTYNGWGWGVYGNQALGFGSWRNGIFTVSEGLKTRYIDRGLTNPYAMNRVYAASPTWGAHVSHFLADIEQFALNYGKEKSGTKLNLDPSVSNSAEISSSATLVYKPQ